MDICIQPCLFTRHVSYIGKITKWNHQLHAPALSCLWGPHSNQSLQLPGLRYKIPSPTFDVKKQVQEKSLKRVILENKSGELLYTFSLGFIVILKRIRSGFQNYEIYTFLVSLQILSQILKKDSVTFRKNKITYSLIDIFPHR